MKHAKHLECIPIQMKHAKERNPSKLPMLVWAFSCYQLFGLATQHDNSPTKHAYNFSTQVYQKPYAILHIVIQFSLHQSESLPGGRQRLNRGAMIKQIKVAANIVLMLFLPFENNNQ